MIRYHWYLAQENLSQIIDDKKEGVRNAFDLVKGDEISGFEVKRV
jgi:hypothetical protein